MFGVFVCLKASSLSRSGAAKSSFVGKQNYLSEKIEGCSGFICKESLSRTALQDVGCCPAEILLFLCIPYFSITRGSESASLQINKLFRK